MTVPVFLLTGFLGSGKTTLLRNLLRDADFGDTAIIINEFGEIALDHVLIERGNDDTILLDRGCVCCSLRSGLTDTLRRVFHRGGKINPYKRVVVETTGLADPIPILQTFILDGGLRRDGHLQSVITVVDAATCLSTLQRHPEAVAQVAVADRIIVTKTDLVDNATAHAVSSELDSLNPQAPRHYVNHGQIRASIFFHNSNSSNNFHRCYGFSRTHKPHHRVASYYVVLDEPLDPDAIYEWLEMLLSVTRGDVLRVKGILNLIGYDRPVAIHGVQHLVHSPHVLEEWPPEDTRASRMVLITRDIASDLVEDTLYAVGIRCQLQVTKV